MIVHRVIKWVCVLFILRPLLHTGTDVVGDLLYLLKVLSVLKRISDEDCQLLGLNPQYARPDWMILQVLPIPPQPVRPSVMMDTSSRSEASVL